MGATQMTEDPRKETVKQIFEACSHPEIPIWDCSYGFKACPRCYSMVTFYLATGRIMSVEEVQRV